MSFFRILSAALQASFFYILTRPLLNKNSFDKIINLIEIKSEVKIKVCSLNSGIQNIIPKK